jgi:hypothetical protein
LAAEIEAAKIKMDVAAVPRSWHAAGPGSLEAELIVHLPFFCVGENVVGFLDLLEFFFGGFVAGIQVRMIFARKLPIGRPDFLLRRLARDAEEVVVILFCGRGHRKSLICGS